MQKQLALQIKTKNVPNRKRKGGFFKVFLVLREYVELQQFVGCLLQ